MGSIGISDTAPVDSPCRPEGALSSQPRGFDRTTCRQRGLRYWPPLPRWSNRDAICGDLWGLL